MGVRRVFLIVFSIVSRTSEGMTFFVPFIEVFFFNETTQISVRSAIDDEQEFTCMRGFDFESCSMEKVFSMRFKREREVRFMIDGILSIIEGG